MKAKLPKGKYSEEFLKFFDYATKYLKKHNKKLEIHDVSYLKKEGKCGGYCDGDKIVIAGKSSNFCQIFLHEWNHEKQIVENSPLLNKEFYWDRFEIDSFDDLYNLILIERDCEIRSLKTNKKWNLFDPIEMAQRANAYLHLHNFMFLKKRYISMPDLHAKEIIDLMPDKIVSAQSLRKIDMDIMNVFEKLLKRKTV